MTQAELRQFLRDHDADSNSTQAQREYDRIIGEARRELSRIGPWSFERTKTRLVLEAAKTAGTVSIAVDGTALTGVGTAFAAADAGKHVRYQGEYLQYLVSAYVSPTALTVEAYRGAADLSGKAYQLTRDRIILPLLFRSVELPLQNSDGQEIQPVTLDEILYWRMNGREVSSTPQIFAIEWAQGAAGAAPVAYLWVYPSPSQKVVIEGYVYLWPDETGASGVWLPVAAEDCFRQLCLAYLYRWRQETERYQSQLATALAQTRRDLGAFAQQKALGQRQEWSSEADAGVRRRRARPASGEPIYT
jgi:hypothetical protein